VRQLWSQSFDFRKRPHSRQIPNWCSHLADYNFLIRMQYADSYWVWRCCILSFYVALFLQFLTSILVRPAAVRRWSADKTSKPAALVDLQSSRRPPVAACQCRRSLFCCCWPTTFEQSTCWRPVCPITRNISSETENSFISAIPRYCSVAALP